MDKSKNENKNHIFVKPIYSKLLHTKYLNYTYIYYIIDILIDIENPIRWCILVFTKIAK